MQREVVFSAEWDDRSANLRLSDTEIARLKADSATRVALIWSGRPLLSQSVSSSVAQVEAGWHAPESELARTAQPEWVFLGHHQGHPRFAAEITDWAPEGFDPKLAHAFFDPLEYAHPLARSEERFTDLKAAMTRIERADAAMLSSARAVFNWHRSHTFCAACGAASQMVMAGWQRSCAACGTQHFPRTDPVVIMLVYHGNKVLLGRSPGWPEGRYSALAGFVEPGEGLEAAVRREVLEETNIRLKDVRYVASQPWAWPNSLMLGFVAEAATTEITLDDELEDAIWVSREEMVEAMCGTHPNLRKPLAGAIAGELLHRWLNASI